MKQLSFVDPNRINEGKMDYGKDFDYSSQEVVEVTHISIYCKEPDNTACTWIKFDENDMLMEVVLLPNYYVNFGSFVELYGEPGYIDYRYIDPESRAGCDIRPIWHQESIAISYTDFSWFSGRDLCKIMEDNGNKPFKDLPIEYITLSNPGFYREEYMESYSGIHNWSGFVEEYPEE